VRGSSRPGSATVRLVAPGCPGSPPRTAADWSAGSPPGVRVGCGPSSHPVAGRRVGPDCRVDPQAGPQRLRPVAPASARRPCPSVAGGHVSFSVEVPGTGTGEHVPNPRHLDAALSAGVRLVVADRCFASSKTCSGCGTAKAKLALSQRTYACMTCGPVLDRDHNAAQNLAALAADTGESRREPPDGNDVRPGHLPPAVAPPPDDPARTQRHHRGNSSKTTLLRVSSNGSIRDRHSRASGWAPRTARKRRSRWVSRSG
jgi:hypothetical protein